MKISKYLISMLAMGAMLSACNDDIDNDKVIDPYTYSDLYYQNLRDYKNSDHEIAFGWFAQYGAANSMAVRFLGLPDSLDICSLWGGIPPEGSLDREEMRFVQKVKGTKMMVVAITRIDAETAEKPFVPLYKEGRAENNQEKIDEAIRQYALYFVDQVFENDLDGFDADYEPEGDYLSGDHFRLFYKTLALYMGPNPDITEAERLELIQERYGKDQTDTHKLLNIDQTSTALPDLAPYSNYCFLQAYGGGTGAGSWPDEQVVYCCNMGDNWQSSMQSMYNQARYKPANGKRKGGFGAFFIHRDYNVVPVYNPEPYFRFRQCIQIQNPAVH